MFKILIGDKYCPKISLGASYRKLVVNFSLILAADCVKYVRSA